MKQRQFVAIACGMLVALAAARAEAQVKQAAIDADGRSRLAGWPLTKGVPSSFDVGGVKLGMTPSEAVEVARARGLKIEGHRTDNPSFEERVVQQMDLLRGKTVPMAPSYTHTRGLYFADNSGSTWSIEFEPTPAGQEAVQIKYRSPLAGRTSQQIVNALEAKFGPASNKSKVEPAFFSFSWCKDARGMDCSLYAPETTLTAMAEANQFVLILKRGAPEVRKLDGLARATAEKRMAASPAANSF
ncbi:MULTISPECIES: hypothetical protein [Sphingomonas]|uniref:Uncharacterized protein n=2 Tax=Sphingomonadaceae TaxID=41297 RepID=A0A7X5Y3M4_9SPHN|nr:hypothetical protein [Sphingomonas sp. ABOLD]NJC00034.1 hypothetical protein [Sphingomonas trueperi]